MTVLRCLCVDKTTTTTTRKSTHFSFWNKTDKKPPKFGGKQSIVLGLTSQCVRLYACRIVSRGITEYGVQINVKKTTSHNQLPFNNVKTTFVLHDLPPVWLFRFRVFINQTARQQPRNSSIPSIQFGLILHNPISIINSCTFSFFFYFRL